MKMLKSNDHDTKDIQLLIQEKLITAEGLDTAYHKYYHMWELIFIIDSILVNL